jgi:hypothetical protein
VGWGHPEREEPSDIDLDEKGPEDFETKGRGLDQRYQAQQNLELPRPKPCMRAML